jgi:peptidoglycan/xylan/chitin deacetylase (PgdA/CDA1 family)
MTHRYLSDLDAETVRWELRESKRCLEALLEKPVRYIAIPSGAYSRAVKALVKESGYEAAFCMLKGTNSRTSDQLALRRLVIGRDFDLDDFRRTLQPVGAFYLRLTGSLQNALLALLGPGGLDGLRDCLYRLGLGSLLTRGQLKYFIPCLGLATFVCLLIAVVILHKQF